MHEFKRSNAVPYADMCDILGYSSNKGAMPRDQDVPEIGAGDLCWMAIMLVNLDLRRRVRLPLYRRRTLLVQADERGTL